jgi:hypothetical protein
LRLAAPQQGDKGEVTEHGGRSSKERAQPKC